MGPKNITNLESAKTRPQQTALAGSLKITFPLWSPILQHASRGILQDPLDARLQRGNRTLTSISALSTYDRFRLLQIRFEG